MMNKDEFLNDLRHALKGLPYEEVNKTLDYYSELIDDAVEDGADEKTFIAGLEDADTIAGRITDETSIRKLVAREVKGKRFSVPAIILIIVGSPIWLSILIAVAASLLALYVSVWSVVVSLFAADVAFAASAVLAVIAMPFVFVESIAKALFFLGTAIACAGLAILGFFVCVWCDKKLIQFTMFIVRKIKYKFIRKEAERI